MIVYYDTLFSSTFFFFWWVLLSTWWRGIHIGLVPILFYVGLLAVAWLCMSHLCPLVIILWSALPQRALLYLLLVLFYYLKQKKNTIARIVIWKSGTKYFNTQIIIRSCHEKVWQDKVAWTSIPGCFPELVWNFSNKYDILLVRKWTPPSYFYPMTKRRCEQKQTRQQSGTHRRGLSRR